MKIKLIFLGIKVDDLLSNASRDRLNGFSLPAGHFYCHCLRSFFTSNQSSFKMSFSFYEMAYGDYVGPLDLQSKLKKQEVVPDVMDSQDKRHASFFSELLQYPYVDLAKVMHIMAMYYVRLGFINKILEHPYDLFPEASEPSFV